MLILLVLASSSKAEEYTYRSWVGRNKFVITEPVDSGSSGHFVLGGDAKEAVNFCDKKSEHYCFSAIHFAFAVPRRGCPPGSKWRARGIEFSLVKTGIDVEIVGRRFEDLWLIRVPATATRYGRGTGSASLALYSPREGLIAYALDEHFQTGPVYWLEGAVGFGRREEGNCGR